MKINIYKEISNCRINKLIPQKYQRLLPKILPEGEYTLIVFSVSKDHAVISKYVEKALRKLTEKEKDSNIIVFAERFTIDAVNVLDNLKIKYFSISGPDTRTDEQYNDDKNRVDPNIK